MVIIKLLLSEVYYQNLIAPTVNHKCLNLNPLNATFSKYQTKIIVCDSLCTHCQVKNLVKNQTESKIEAYN